ncbi:MAG TPA: DUF2795 domain-containing protein [Oscillatoriaceae cyanobacterium]
MAEKRSTLHEALRGITFPATQEDLVHHAEERGVETITWNNQPMRLRVVFNRFPNVVFMSVADVENAVEAARSDSEISSEAIMRRGPTMRPREDGPDEA